jgi:hypothetical protein
MTEFENPWVEPVLGLCRVNEEDFGAWMLTLDSPPLFRWCVCVCFGLCAGAATVCTS